MVPMVSASHPLLIKLKQYFRIKGIKYYPVYNNEVVTGSHPLMIPLVIRICRRTEYVTIKPVPVGGISFSFPCGDLDHAIKKINEFIKRLRK